MKTQNILLKLSVLAGLSFSGIAKAVCPVCVVAVGAGLGFSRWLGVDDTVTSIWIGALVLSMVLWTLSYMEKKKWKFPYDIAVISLAYYILVFVPLYWYGIVGHPGNTIFGTDKIIFGSFLGSVIVLAAYWLNLALKKKNNGKVYFPYQRVIIPFAGLVLTSLIFFF